ncbi:hypothetical protein NT239_07535 [Chitinibacter sp. SCUT-21]|uniref:hypothetical protein n=1 Tax=Chitinibacter sp. SCUT-21 TaxID=2970891 RepID=UPI0035A5C20C
MKLAQFERGDWGLIRVQLLWFGAAMLVAGLIIFIAQIYVYFSEAELHAQRSRLQETTQSAEKAQLQWQAVQQYQQQNLTLQRLGIIGQEHRLDWIEALAQLKQAHPAWQLDYAFAPQHKKEGATPTHQVALYASEMKVRWLAANEWDISAFAEWLAQQKGRAVAKECRFARSANPQLNGIEVDCRYDWLSIAPHRESAQ